LQIKRKAIKAYFCDAFTGWRSVFGGQKKRFLSANIFSIAKSVFEVNRPSALEGKNGSLHSNIFINLA